MRIADSRPGFVLKGWHVLVGFILFFGVDIAINTVFMVQAYATYPGEASETPYEDGVAYNGAIAQLRAQQAVGWRISADGSSSGALRTQVVDRQGAPLAGLAVSGVLQRPATEAGRKVVSFHATQPGVYSADAGRLDGAWDLELTVRDDKGRKALAERRLVLP